MRKLFTTLLLGLLCTFAYAQTQMPSAGLAASATSAANASHADETPLSAQRPIKILGESAISVQMQIFCPDVIASFRGNGFTDAQIQQKFNGVNGIDNVAILNNDVIQAKLDNKNTNFLLTQYFNIKN